MSTSSTSSGWNRPRQNAPKAKPKKPSALRGVVAGVIVVGIGIGIGAYFGLFSSGNGEAPSSGSGNRAIKSVAPSIPKPQKAPSGATAGTNAVANAQPPPPPPPEKWLGKDVKEHLIRTNDTLVIETFITADGKTHKYYHDLRENALPSGADQILAMMTQDNDGFGAPPLPHIDNFENEFGEALKKEIVINDDDLPEVKEVKERVRAARKEMLELMAEGMSADDVIREWQQMQEDNATVRLDAALKVRELLDQGDREGAEQLCQKYNEILEQSGIMKLELPEEDEGRSRRR